MGDVMRPVPFKELVRRGLREYAEQRSIFGIPEIHFFRKQNRERIRVFGELCDTPVGPAAGPHTQMAQNIGAAYLAGGRFFELKTVQKLDSLEIEKPCIDARDEGYNTEWSTEFSLEQAYGEYLKAWFLLHIFEELFELRLDPSSRGFIFNMSVGYDLTGIKTPKMDHFINSLIDASDHPLFNRYKEEMQELFSNGSSLLDGTGLEDRLEALHRLAGTIAPAISPSVTLSTMHGCPPDEQEAICRYLLEEKQIDTFLKLNPTLLGYQRVRVILDRLGFTYLHISKESFQHDLQYDDAVSMLQRLMKRAEGADRRFGIKLSNTLGSINDQGVLPGDDMYMSGRALYPLTVTLASVLAEEFGGKIPISYAGGANALNVEKLFAAGIRPITAATELLKPGGYIRLKEMALKTELSEGWKRAGAEPGDRGRAGKTAPAHQQPFVYTAALSRLAEESLAVDYTQKQFRGSDRIEIGADLPLYDCYTAPCQAACPIGQNVPEYIRLLGQERYADALDVIYEENALPNITGYICDHQCMYNCTRLDYEGSVMIREMKRIAAEQGWKKYLEGWSPPERRKEARAAVVGAGPAGLAAAYFLAREGFAVTVFEKHGSAGGVVRHVIPHFRLPVEAIERDVEFIRAHGVEFHFNCDPTPGRDELLSRGFTYIFLGIGAGKDSPVRIEGPQERVRTSLSFLGNYRKDPAQEALGEEVVVVGGGNTAMDSARAATKVSGVKKVTVLYRRAFEQMPADLEEYENAVREGVIFRFLTLPEKISPNGDLTVRRMKLGEEDASGRPRPIPTDETEVIHADTVISAIGEKVDVKALADFGLPLDKDGRPEVDEESLETGLENVFLGGDAYTGPSTVVQCINAGRRAADAICRKEEPQWKRAGRVPRFDPDTVRREVLPRKGSLIRMEGIKAAGSDAVFAQHEAVRCLQCSYICNKCVEVCPNRANMVIEVPEEAGFSQKYQIIHIDAFCNECGNCETFCPWEGRPYRDKFTVFSSMEDFSGSENSGFLLIDGGLEVRMDGQEQSLKMDRDGTVSGGVLDPRAAALIETVIRKHGYLLGGVEVEEK